jgi:hypothetical protein
VLLALLNRSPDPGEFEELSSAVEAMVVRRSLVGAAPNDVEQAVGPLCRQVTSGAITTGGVVARIRQLASEKQKDDTFELASADSSQARYILLALENHARSKTKPKRMPLPYDLRKIDVEHILPETTAGTNWNEAEWGSELESSKTRLANFALLDRSANRAAKNADYNCGAAKAKIGPKNVVCCKRHAYQLNKDIELTTRIAKDFSKWNPASLRKRARQLAELAAERWPLI